MEDDSLGRVEGVDADRQRDQCRVAHEPQRLAVLPGQTASDVADGPVRAGAAVAAVRGVQIGATDLHHDVRRYAHYFRLRLTLLPASLLSPLLLALLCCPLLHVRLSLDRFSILLPHT